MKVLIPGPALLWEIAAQAAKREGVSRSEWVRRAMRVRLGWREVLDQNSTDTDDAPAAP